MLERGGGSPLLLESATPLRLLCCPSAFYMFGESCRTIFFFNNNLFMNTCQTKSGLWKKKSLPAWCCSFLHDALHLNPAGSVCRCLPPSHSYNTVQYPAVFWGGWVGSKNSIVVCNQKNFLFHVPLTNLPKKDTQISVTIPIQWRWMQFYFCSLYSGKSEAPTVKGTFPRILCGCPISVDG